MRNDVWAVLISDVHFNIKLLSLAATSLRAAFQKAQELGVPLIIAGDLNDTKAAMRAECINAILEIFREYSDVTVYVLIGNHDLINEKGGDHTLHFLDDVANIVRSPVWMHSLDLHLIPYFSDSEKLKEHLKLIPEGSTLIMHQGLLGAHMGEYIVDKSSLPPETFANFRVVSGHYHRHQNIKCGRPRKGAVGLFSYIGTPYSVTFAEAHDGPKGIQLLLKNGLLEQVPLNLRKHMIVEATTSLLQEADEAGADPFELPNPGDLFWLKLSGPASDLDAIDKKKLAAIIGTENFKLDKIYDSADKIDQSGVEELPYDELLDKVIDDSEETTARKKMLKSLWREILP